MSLSVRHGKSYLELGEAQALEQAATNMRDRLLVRLLFHLGVDSQRE